MPVELLLLAILSVLLPFTVMMRFGILPAVGYWMFMEALELIKTADASMWYFNATLFVTLLILATIVLSFRMALAGRWVCSRDWPGEQRRAPDLPARTDSSFPWAVSGPPATGWPGQGAFFVRRSDLKWTQQLFLLKSPSGDGLPRMTTSHPPRHALGKSGR